MGMGTASFAILSLAFNLVCLASVVFATACPPLQAPEFGTVRVLPGWKAGYAYASYKCNKGYKLQGTSFRSCCLGQWLLSDETVTCELIECNFASDGFDCIYENVGPNNKVGWKQEITTSTTQTVEMKSVSFSSRKKRSMQLTRNRRMLPTISRRSISIVLRWLGSQVNIDSETFEVGYFTRSVLNNFLMFNLRTTGAGIVYHIIVDAHCRPDPPRELVQLGNVEDDTQSFSVAFVSTRRKSVCLNLRDAISCSRFAVRFKATVVSGPKSEASISVFPEGLHATSALCEEVNNSN